MIPLVCRAISGNAFLVVVDLIKHASSHRLERSVHGTRWTAGIGWSRETLSAIALRIVADDEVASEQVNLLPVILNKTCPGVFTRDKAQEARTAAALARFVKIAREDLLLDAGRIARR